MTHRPPAILLGLFLLPGGCGFDVGYALHAVTGQAGLLLRSIPIEQALASPDLSEEERRKLQLVVEARDFAGSEFALYTGNSFHTYFDGGDQPVAINLSASRKDAFDPQLWTFPIAGTLASLGYFDRAAADAERHRLEADGWDVFTYEIDAYTNGEPLTNPALSPLLKRPDDVIVDLVIHELLHATIFRPDDASFNESLATFIGQEGALRFWRSRYPDQPERVQIALNRYADRDRYRAFALETYDQLAAYYATALPSADKIAGRSALFDAARARFAADVQPFMHTPANYDFVATLDMNNAYLLLFRRYNLDLDVFQDVLDAKGGDLPAALAVFRAASGVEGDPFAYLRAQAGGG